MEGNSFFEEQTEQSQIKAQIVERYFSAWARVMLGAANKYGHESKIAYIDLFAGPGRYYNSAKSTPVMVLEKAIADDELSSSLVTYFNDKDVNNVQNLQTTISELPGVQKLKYLPKVVHGEVNEDTVKNFEDVRLIPTLFFIDPFGYKGLSLRLINSVLKDWGCDCIVFFNFNRINMGISNIAVEPHMQALFGEERVERLRGKLDGKSPVEREEIIIKEINAALMEMSTEHIFVLPFRFKREDGSRTSHYLIFVTKHIKGFDIMKDVMAKASSSEEEGVSSFEYNRLLKPQPRLFSQEHIENLKQALLEHFAGREVNFQTVYSEYEVYTNGTFYLQKNYREALKRLEEEGRFDFRYAGSGKRRKGTYSENTTIIFPIPT